LGQGALPVSGQRVAGFEFGQCQQPSSFNLVLVGVDVAEVRRRGALQVGGIGRDTLLDQHRHRERRDVGDMVLERAFAHWIGGIRRMRGGDAQGDSQGDGQ